MYFCPPTPVVLSTFNELSSYSSKGLYSASEGAHVDYIFIFILQGAEIVLGLL